MTAVLKNLRSFLREHTVFFILMLVCICVSSGLMLFGYGLYQNYKYEQKNMAYTTTAVSFLAKNIDNINENPELYWTHEQIRKCVEAIPDQTHNEMFCIMCFYEYDRTNSDISTAWCESYFTYKNERYQGHPLKYENYVSRDLVHYEGEYFSEDAYAIGEKHVIVSELSNKKIGDTLRLNGEEFKIISTVKSMEPHLPFLSVPDSMSLINICFDFKKPVTSEQYISIISAFESLSMDLYTVNEYEPFYDENYWLYNTIILVSVLIAVVAAFNIVVVYQYVLVKRQKSLAVFQICGCTKGKAIRMYVAESLIMIIFGFCAIALIYHFGLLPLLQNVFPFIATAYSFKLYAMAFAIYITICTIGTALLANMVVRKHSIVELKGGTAEC